MEAHTPALATRVEELRRSARLVRLRSRAPRYLVSLAAVVLSLAGLRALVAPAPAPELPAELAARVDPAMEGFAARFARAYLSYDPARAEADDALLDAFVSAGMDAQAGRIPPEAPRRVEWTQVAQNQEALAGGRVVVVEAKLAGEGLSRYLAVPVARTPGGELQVTGYPSFVGAPAEAAEAELPVRRPVDDASIEDMAARVVTNYLERQPENLAADLAADATVSLPSAALRVERVDDVVWADGPESGAVLVTLEAREPGSGASYVLTYELGVDRREGRPVATFIETVPTDT
jgi:hypothetical protein